MDEGHHHHHQAPTGPNSGNPDDVRTAQVFPGYPQPYPSHSASGSSMPPVHDGINGPSHHSAIAARRQSRDEDVNPHGLFPDIPDAKKRKFILVEDSKRGCRLRVRVTLENVDTKEIPDSFRKSSSIFPRSYFPREMQSPPPSAMGGQFFQEDLSDDEVEVEGGRTGRSRGNARDRAMIKVSMSDGNEGEVAIPRTRKVTRGKEVRLNDLGYRMAWLQSRVFAGRTIFLQRARTYSFHPNSSSIHEKLTSLSSSSPVDCYRNKTRTAIESIMQDVKTSAPHFETRIGKRRWSERMRRGDKHDDE